MKRLYYIYITIGVVDTLQPQIHSFPCELHLVHYKTSYGSLGGAVMQPDGLVVLGVMLRIDASNNSKLDSIIAGLANVHQAGKY